MRLTVEKLGLIERAELDIRPLTVLIGENGTNKTWVAYALYGLVRSMVEGDPAYRHLASENSPSIGFFVDHVSAAVEAAYERVLNENSALLETLVQQGSENVSLEWDFSKSLPQDASDYALIGSEDFLEFLLRLPAGISQGPIQLDLGFQPPSSPVKLEVTPVPGGARTKFQFHSGRTLERYWIKEGLLRNKDFWLNRLQDAFSLWSSPTLSGVFILPAERKALASAHDLLRDEFTEAVSVPVADYAEFLRTRRNLMAHGATLQTKAPLRDVAELLESRIVKGAIGFRADAENVRFAFSPSAQVELPIHAASSLVRALAGLDLYLQSMAQPGDFLFIDEVEMNAHPEAQLALTELLAMLVNRGLRVVMTTHSPFIVEHLNNLMAAARVAPEGQDELSPHFRLQRREAFLSADKVSAYHFAPVEGKVEVRDVMNRESEAIDWRTFSRVTDELSNLYGRILEVKERP